MGFFTPAGVSAAGSFLSGISGLFGGGSKGPTLSDQRQANRLMMEDQAKIQREFAKNSIQWRMEDAKAAGIHPLYAAGIQPFSPSVSPVGMDFSERSSGRDLSGAMDSMGQGITRAAGAFKSREAKDIEMASATLALENQQLQNERLRSEINLMRSPGTHSGMSDTTVIPGQGNSDVMKVPKEFHAGVGGLEVGERQALQKMFFPGMGPIRTKSEALGEAMEDSLLGSLMVDLLYTLPDMAVNSAKELPSALSDIFSYLHSNHSLLGKLKKWRGR